MQTFVKVIGTSRSYLQEILMRYFVSFFDNYPTIVKANHKV